MLTETYIEALLVDEELADQVWEAWDADVIDDLAACWAWWLIAGGRFTPIAAVGVVEFRGAAAEPKADINFLFSGKRRRLAACRLVSVVTIDTTVILVTHDRPGFYHD